MCKYHDHVILRTAVGCQVGRDVAACLQEALIRNGLDVRVAALVRKYFLLTPSYICILQLQNVAQNNV